MDLLAIAVYAAHQLIWEADEMEVLFVLTLMGPIVEIVSAKKSLVI